MGELGRLSLPAVSRLIEILTNAEPALRAAAARSLGEIGPPAREALPALKAADPSDRILSSVARDAIRRLEAEPDGR